MICVVDLYGEFNACTASINFDNNKEIGSNFRKLDIQMQSSDVSLL